MKRLLVLVCLVLIASPALAQSFTFQSDDVTEYFTNNTQTGCGAKNNYGFVQWVHNTTAGNSYMNMSACPTKTGLAYVATATPTTYAAVTFLGDAHGSSGGAAIVLMDSTKSGMYTYGLPAFASAARYEINIVGGIPFIYRNGILVENGTSPMATNPSYVGFGSYSGDATSAYSHWDDVIIGSSENRELVGAPEPNQYYIKKDFVNPSSSGLYNISNTLINSNLVTFTFARSNLSGEALINESIYLKDSTGTVRSTRYTGTATYRTDLTFDFATDLVAADAPYGFYTATLNDSVSDRITYIANGASIAFDKATYSQAETATVTYLVDAAYWIPGTYTYKIVIADAYGNIASSQNIASSSGTVTYTFTSSNTQGVYYAEIIAVPTTGSEILMNFDYATLAATFGFTGYVNAYNGTPISGASVTYAQGSTIENTTSGVDGNYSVSNFLTGISIWSNTSATGYETQNFTFMVQSGHNIVRNITLNVTTPVYTGLGIGGVCRDGVFTNPNTITNGYGRPIPAATCFLKNTTNAELYNTTGNIAGWYQFDESTSTYLTANRPYDLWCQRTGYGNSANETVQVTV